MLIKPNFYSLHTQAFGKQKGLVLFIALIALVVLSLAAVALIRSVDTNTMIAGNLGFKQSATMSADSGVETAITWLNANQAAATTEADQTASGYYATSAANAKTLADASALVATGAGIVAGYEATSGNTITYVIQRMCRAAGPSNTANCMYGPPGVVKDSNLVCDASNPCLNPTPANSLMYRVTTKVVGPRNTVSYTQAFIY